MCDSNRTFSEAAIFGDPSPNNRQKIALYESCAKALQADPIKCHETIFGNKP